jgi:hypothetical protein
MSKQIARRLNKLERKYQPEGRTIAVLDTPENRTLLAQGFLPDDTQTTAPPEPTRGATDCSHPARRRLGPRDIVVLMSAVEMAL